MEKPRPSTVAWGATVAGIAAYDLLCPKGEMMSERAREWLEHPIKKRLFESAVVAMSLHLTRRIPPEYDLVSHILREKGVVGHEQRS